jgi:hypothetical protein
VACLAYAAGFSSWAPIYARSAVSKDFPLRERNHISTRFPLLAGETCRRVSALSLRAATQIPEGAQAAMLARRRVNGCLLQQRQQVAQLLAQPLDGLYHARLG